MTSLVSSFALNQLRRAENSTHQDTVTLRNPGATTIGAGGGVVAGTPVDTTGVRCRIVEGVSGNVRDVADRLQLVNPCTIRFAYNQSGVTERTMVMVDGREFHVQAVSRDKGYLTRLLAICSETKGKLS